MVSRIPYSKSVFLLVFAATIFPLILFSLVSTGVSAKLVDSIIETNVSDGLEAIGLRLETFTEKSGRGLVKVAASLDTLKMLGKEDSHPERTRDIVDELIQGQFRSDEPPVDLYLVSPSGTTEYSNMALKSSNGRDTESTKTLIEEILKRPAGITLYARRHSLTQDSYISFSMATAVIGPSGKPVGYIIADIPRETLRTVLAPIPKLSELVLLDGDDYIAWSLSDPEREGTRYDLIERGKDPLRIEHRSGRLSLVAWKPAELVTGLVEKITFITFLCLTISLVLAFTISYIISLRLSKPVTKLIEATRAVADGDLSVRLESDGSGDIALLMQNFNAMVGDLKSLFARTVEEQELLKRAELDSLGSQLNPHFFFNALSSISALAKLGACKEINTVTIALAKLFRSSLASTSGASTIAGSLAETRNYLTIEKIRFTDRFTWTEEIGEGLGDCEVPRLGIQSLVENALIHGIEPNPEQSMLRIRVSAEPMEAGSNGSESIIRIEVEDNGVGIGEAKLAKINENLAGGKRSGDEKHIGLSNTNRRIALVYGSQYGIRLRAREGGGIIAVMTVPLRRATQCTE
jgi:sensor histidine kinase YesM